LLAEINNAKLAKMIYVCLELLDGVGSGNDKITRGEGTTAVSIGVRRSLSDGEIAGLLAEWLAIPAVDCGTLEEEIAYESGR
jgi:hypothetical protein